MAKLTPMQQVKEQFGTKEKLAAQLASDLITPEGFTKDEFEYQLKCTSNSKLLRLAQRVEAMKKLGGFDKLAAAVTELQGGNADHLRINKGKSIGQLLDLHSSLTRRAKKA